MSLALRSLFNYYPTRLYDDDFWYSPLVNFQQNNKVSKTETHTTYSFSFPGLRKKDLVVELDNGMLHIGGKSTITHNHSTQTVSYSQSISVNRNLIEEDIAVSYNDGMLHISVPNSIQTNQRRRIPIQ